MMRVDDLRAVAEAPAFLLLPASLPYNATPLDVVAGFALHHAPRPELHRLRLAQHAPISFSRPAVSSAFLNVEYIDFDRQTLASRYRLLRRARRIEARLLGRRRATPVPITIVAEVRVFAQSGVDPLIVERMVRDYAVVVARSWRHGNAVDWARRACNLRVKRERKAARR